MTDRTTKRLGMIFLFALLGGVALALIVDDGPLTPKQQIQAALQSMTARGRPSSSCMPTEETRILLASLSSDKAGRLSACFASLAPTTSDWTNATEDFATRTYRARTDDLICEVTIVAMVDWGLARSESQYCDYAIFQQDDDPGPGTLEKPWL